MQRALLLLGPGKRLLLFMLDRVLCCCLIECPSSTPTFLSFTVRVGGGGGHMAVHSRMPLIHTHLPSFTIGGGGGAWLAGRGTTCSSHTDVAQTTSLTCGSLRICAYPQQMSQRVESSSLKQVFAGMVQVHRDACQQHF